MIASLVVLLLAGPVGATPAYVGPPGVPVIEAPPATIDMRVAALLISDQQGGPLPMAAAAIRRQSGRFDSGAWTTEVRVDLDGASLLDALAAAGDEPVVVELFVYAVGERLEVVDAATLAVTLDRDDGPALGATGLRVVVPFATRAEPTTARVLARVGDRFGLRGVTLPPRTDGPALLEPRFASTEPWLLAHPRGSAPREGLDILPVVAIGTPVEPTFDRIGAADVAVALRLVPTDGDEAVDLPVGDALPPLETGRYSARLVALDATAAVTPSAAIDLVVVDGSAYVVPWPRLARLGTAPVAVEAGDEVLLPDDLRDALDVLETGWLEALAALPETGVGEGTAAIRRLELDARRIFGPQGVRALARVRAEVVEDLERRLRRNDAGRGALLPILALDLELERLHSDAGRFGLARRAMDDALRVARRIAETLPDADLATRRQLAAAFGWFADRLQRRGFVDQAEELLREGLALDSADGQLRFALFANLVRHGRPGDAVDELEPAGTLVEGVPAREVLLRRGVAERRAGRLGAAGASFGELVGDDDDWITTVATQELAVVHLERGRPEQAEEIARAGLRRLGDEPGLRVILARALVHQGRVGAARDTLLAIAPTPGRENPRTRLNAWPTGGLDARRGELMSTAEDRADALAAAARNLLEDRR